MQWPTYLFIYQHGHLVHMFFPLPDMFVPPPLSNSNRLLVTDHIKEASMCLYPSVINFPAAWNISWGLSGCSLCSLWLFVLTALTFQSELLSPRASLSFAFPTRTCHLQLHTSEYLQAVLMLQLKLVKSQHVPTAIAKYLILDHNLEWLIWRMLHFYSTSDELTFFHLSYSKWSVCLCSGLQHHVKEESTDTEFPYYVCKAWFDLPHHYEPQLLEHLKEKEPAKELELGQEWSLLPTGIKHQLSWGISFELVG